MKAIRYDRYGPPDVLELADVDLPEVGEDEMLVRVRAASVNPLDWHVMRGTPYLVRMMAGLSRPRASAARLRFPAMSISRSYRRSARVKSSRV